MPDLNSIVSEVEDLEQSKTVIDGLKSHVAALQTDRNEVQVAFEVVTNKWNTMAGDARDLLSQLKEDEQGIVEKVKELVEHLVGNTATVRQIGLADLPDALKPATSEPFSPAASPPLTTPITAENVNVTPAGDVVIAATPVVTEPSLEVEGEPETEKSDENK